MRMLATHINDTAFLPGMLAPAVAYVTVVAVIDCVGLFLSSSLCSLGGRGGCLLLIFQFLVFQLASIGLVSVLPLSLG